LLVLLLLLVACTGGGGTSQQSESQRPQRIASLEVAKSTADEVRLRWRSADPPPDELIITRNGERLKQLPGSAVMFTDTKVSPGTRYVYEIVARKGELDSDPVRAVARTLVPPVTEAVLEGTFSMSFTLLSSNISNPGPNVETGKWRLTPLCRSGPCDVRMESLSGKYGLRLAWLPSSEQYKGAVVHKDYYVCASKDLDAILQVVLSADSAKVVEGIWIATKLHGQLTYDANEASICLEQAHEVLAVRGSRMT
jgi:hypothetical protein